MLRVMECSRLYIRSQDSLHYCSFPSIFVEFIQYQQLNEFLRHEHNDIRILS